MCGETHIPRDICAGKHDTRGNTHPYDTGNKPQTEGAILKFNYCFIQASSEKIIYTMDHYNQ